MTDQKYNKNSSFIIHIDSLDFYDDFDDLQLSEFHRAVKFYFTTGNLPDNLSLVVKVAIKPFVRQWERDNEKYSEVCKKNKANGLKGGRPKKEITEDIPEKPIGYFENRQEPKKAYTNNDNNNNPKPINKNNPNRVTPLTPQICFDNFDFEYFLKVGIDLKEPIKRWIDHRQRIGSPYTHPDEIKSLSEQLIADHKSGRDILNGIRLSVNSGKWITIIYKDDHGGRNGNANTPNNKDVMRQQERDRILYQCKGRDYYDVVMIFIDSKKKLQFQYKPCSDEKDIIMKADCDKYGICYPRKKDIKDLRDVVTKAGFKIEELDN